MITPNELQKLTGVVTNLPYVEELAYGVLMDLHDGLRVGEDKVVSFLPIRTSTDMVEEVNALLKDAGYKTKTNVEGRMIAIYG